MKRLYYSSAKCDDKNLKSYSTDIIYNDGEYINMFIYGSQTTYQHIHKYFKWLKENGYSEYENTVHNLYNAIMKIKSESRGCIEISSGEINIGTTNKKMGYGISYN